MSNTAEFLRRTAALMRERAEAATPGPWETGDKGYMARIVYVEDGSIISDASYITDAQHIASMHPAVALAVADWLEGCADRAEQTSTVRLEHDPEERAWFDPALAVARAYNPDESDADHE